MSPSCPISSVRVDSNMVRAVSLQITLLTLLLIFSGSKFLAVLLFLDFTVRALRMPQFSIFNLTAKLVLKHFSVTPKMVDESPKRFALYLGWSVSFFILFFYALGLVKMAVVTAVILLFCASLETAFDYCIGCKLYYVIQITKVKFTS